MQVDECLGVIEAFRRTITMSHRASPAPRPQCVPEGAVLVQVLNSVAVCGHVQRDLLPSVGDGPRRAKARFAAQPPTR